LLNISFRFEKKLHFVLRDLQWYIATIRFVLFTKRNTIIRTYTNS